jgi:hypothetical protein
VPLGWVALVLRTHRLVLRLKRVRLRAAALAFLDEEYNRQEKKKGLAQGLGKYLIILAIGVRAGPPRGALRAFELGQERTLLLAVLVEAELCSCLQAAVGTPVPLVVLVNKGPCLAAYCTHRPLWYETYLRQQRITTRPAKRKGNRKIFRKKK